MGSLKSEKALRTIGEVSKALGVPSHVIRFWEENFSSLRPVKYNKRRYYSTENIRLLKEIKSLLYDQGYSIKGATIYLKSELRKVPSLEGIMQKLIKARDRLTELL